MLLIRVDHIDFHIHDKRQWPSAVTDLTRLVMQNEQFLKFMLRTLLTIDEEIVERAESKSSFELEISNNVKDSMRAEAVPSLISLFQSVLQQFQQFETKVVQQTLQVCA